MSSASTSRNFDGAVPGYRLWTVDVDEDFHSEYRELPVGDMAAFAPPPKHPGLVALEEKLQEELGIPSPPTLRLDKDLTIEEIGKHQFKVAGAVPLADEMGNSVPVPFTAVVEQTTAEEKWVVSEIRMEWATDEN